MANHTDMYYHIDMYNHIDMYYHMDMYNHIDMYNHTDMYNCTTTRMTLAVAPREATGWSGVRRALTQIIPPS